MNILYLISHAGKAGTEKYVWELMEVFSRRGDVCHLVYGEDGELSRKSAAAGCPTVQMDLRPRHVLSAARRLARYCETNRIDVIHAQYPRENVIAVLSRRFRPETRVIFTSHLTIRQGPLWRAANRIITPRDDRVVSVCTQGAELLRENGVAPERIRVIFNGVVPGPLPPRKNVIREEYGLGEETFVFLTMARYAPEKGLDALLASLAALREKTDLPFVCVIAGDGEEYDRITEEIRRLGLEEQVIQAGYRTDTEDLLCSADAYVSTALYNEAMSFAILEAMSCALPLAVTDVGAGRDLAEGCGLAVPPGDPEAMAEALCTLLADRTLCAALGRAARERVCRTFDFRKSAEELRRVYEGRE